MKKDVKLWSVQYAWKITMWMAIITFLPFFAIVLWAILAGNALVAGSYYGRGLSYVVFNCVVVWLLSFGVIKIRNLIVTKRALE